MLSDNSKIFHSMHKTVIRSTCDSGSDSQESKYTVAEILSSMTSTARLPVTTAAPITPVSFSSGAAPSFPVSSTSVPILTPTTLNNLERSFEIASSQELNTNNSAIATSSESGFIPPVVNPIVIDPAQQGTSAGAHQVMGVKREYDVNWDDDMSSCSSNDPEWNPNSSKRSRTDKNIVANIDPQTYLMTNSRRPTGPRKERRDSNMMPDELEKRQQRRVRNKEAAAKCRQKRVEQTNVLINQTENLEEEKAELENEIANLHQQKEQLQFLLEAHKPTCKHNQSQQQALIKSEQDLLSSIASSFPAALVPTSQPAIQSRPSTLPLRTTQIQAPATTAAIGVSINTPSSGMYNLGLDTLLEGHTGLTPLTAGPPTCSSQVQQQQRQSDSSSSPTDMGSPNSNLITL